MIKKVGLRIDVDTWYGTKYGVPRLLDILNKYDVKGTFFFSVGPDNMGKHIWRLVKPKFLLKILRSNGISSYGWQILLAGTFKEKKIIGKNLAHIIQNTSYIHEIGLHAWDHYAWQTWAKYWKKDKLIEQISLGYNFLSSIINKSIDCSAAAGWRINNRILKTKQQFNFHYNSDCRGTHVFIPKLSDKIFGTVQIPVTLPTWDEIIGRNDINKKNYNNFIINKMKYDNITPVYTIHAEIEGIKMHNLFNELLNITRQEGIKFCSLRSFLPKDINSLPISKIICKSIPGRDGWVGYQSPE